MIIQSDFHDYYDSVAAKYRDNKIVYNRKTIEMEINDDFRELIIEYCKVFDILGKIQDKREEICAILFCGKIYPFFYSKSFYNTELIIDFVSPYSRFELSEDITRFIKYFKNWVPFYYDKEYSGEGIKSNICQELNKKYAPVILIHDFYKRKVVLNPSLKDLHFHLDVNTVSQSLFQFLAPKEPETIKTDDKYKVISHGFNQESFRREKGGPTRKRKRLTNN